MHKTDQATHQLNFDSEEAKQGTQRIPENRLPVKVQTKPKNTQKLKLRVPKRQNITSSDKVTSQVGHKSNLQQTSAFDDGESLPKGREVSGIVLKHSGPPCPASRKSATPP